MNYTASAPHGGEPRDSPSPDTSPVQSTKAPHWTHWTLCDNSARARAQAPSRSPSPQEPPLRLSGESTGHGSESDCDDAGDNESDYDDAGGAIDIDTESSSSSISDDDASMLELEHNTANGAGTMAMRPRAASISFAMPQPVLPLARTLPGTMVFLVRRSGAGFSIRGAWMHAALRRVSRVARPFSHRSLPFAPFPFSLLKNALLAHEDAAHCVAMPYVQHIFVPALFYQVVYCTCAAAVLAENGGMRVTPARLRRRLASDTNDLDGEFVAPATWMDHLPNEVFEKWAS